MTGLDAAIRRAIDRAGAHDAPAREQVYRTARMALEKGIAQRSDLDPAAIDAQRQRFDEMVRRIEAEKNGENGTGPAVIAVEPPTVALPEDDAHRSPAPAIDMRSVAPASAAADPAAGSFDGLAAEVRADRPPAQPVRAKHAGKPRRPAPKHRKGRAAARLFSALFLLVSLFVFGAIGLWLLDQTGLLDEGQSAGGNANSFVKFDATGSGGRDLVTEDGFVGAWTPLFVPDKTGNVTLGAAATKTAVKDDRGKALRLKSATANPDADIRITIPAETLNAMAGRVSTVALNVRGVDGHPTEIAVECAFTTAGGCERHRFEVHAEMTDIVFRVDLSKTAPPNEPGALVLNTDIQGKGRAIDLFAAGLRTVK